MLDWLKAILGDGYTEEIDKSVSNEIGRGFVSKSDFNGAKEDLKRAKESLAERDGQLEALKGESGAAEKLKARIAELQAENQRKDREHEAEVKRLRRAALDERLLTEAGAREPAAVMPFLPAVDGGVDDEGYAAVRSEQIAALTKTESKQFLFKAAGVEPNPFTGVKPGETGAKPPPTGTGNPFAKGGHYDEAEQIRLFRESPELARTYMRQAGLML